MALPVGVSVDSIRAVYETLVGTGTSASTVQGNVASGATDSGNPVKVGGVFNTALPTLTNGQRGDIQLSAKGAQITTAYTLAGVAVSFVANNADGVAVSATIDKQAVLGYVAKFNGTSFDRDRKPNGTKILPSAAASTNPDFAKASAGDLWCISGFNAAASVRYLKVFNKASAPTVGTDTPVMVIALPVGSFNINLSGHYLGTGIAFALTTGAALLDVGALTAADIVGLTLTYA